MTPYAREMRLMPVINNMEQRGIHLDGEKLHADTQYYFKVLEQLDNEIIGMLGTKIDVDSNAQLADAIQVRYPTAVFDRTPTGLRSTAKESLLKALNQTNPQLLGHLLCRGAIATCARTFFQPWLNQYQLHGRLFMRWNYC